jgi:outer membrane protein TolC
MNYQQTLAVNQFKHLLGIKLVDSFLITESSIYKAPSLDNANFKTDIDVTTTFHQYQFQKMQFDASLYSIVPNLSAFYNYSKQQNNNSFKPFADATAHPWFKQEQWGLKATLPLVTGGNRILLTQKLKLSKNQAFEQWKNAQETSAINDANLKIQLVKSYSQMESAEQIMLLQKQNYSILKSKYNEGVLPLDDLLKSFMDFSNAQNDYLKSLSDYLVQNYLVTVRTIEF